MRRCPGPQTTLLSTDLPAELPSLSRFPITFMISLLAWTTLGLHSPGHAPGGQHWICWPGQMFSQGILGTENTWGLGGTQKQPWIGGVM